MICYLDCDTGIDDALALAMLLASPGVDLLGAGTVSGNTGADQGARNTLDVLGGLRVEEDGHLVEDPSAEKQTRVVLTLSAEAAPLIRTLICGAEAAP